MSSAIAVTGIGMLTSLGDTRVGVVESVVAGRVAARPSQWLSDAGEAVIDDFDATRYVNVRGMRVYGRATRMGLASLKLALSDSGVPEGAPPPERRGLITASTFGHLETLFEYDRSLLTAGFMETNPALMPVALPSSPGSAIALGFGAKAFSITLAGQGTSSLDAVSLGARLLLADRADVALVVSTFAQSEELTRAAHRAGTLTSADRFRVFDAQHCGTVLGEASVAVVLERAETARARQADVRAWLHGFASGFACGAEHLAGALARVIHRALSGASIDASKIGVISSGASGVPSIDRAEAEALLAEFADGPPVLATKGNFGDTLDASGLLGAVVALDSARSGRLPGVPRLERPSVSGLRYANREATPRSPFVLATAVSPTGACTAAIFSCS